MKRLFFASIVGFATSCTNVSVKVPSARIFNPEIIQPQKIGLDGTIASGKNINVSDLSARPPTFNTGISNSLYFEELAGYGLLPRLEVDGGFVWPSGDGGFDFGYQTRGKFQVLGEPRGTAKVGNVSLTVIAGYGVFRGTNKGDQKSFGSAGGYGWKGTLQSANFEWGSSLGYKASDIVTMYLGYSENRNKINLELNQDANTSSSPDPGGTFTQSYVGQTQAVGGGLAISTKSSTYLQLDGRWVTGYLHNTNIGEGQYSLSVGFLLN